MKILHSGNVYGVELTEDLWYGVSMEARHAIANKIKSDAEAAGATYVNIMVQPDALFSNCDKSERHSVWRHTFTPPVAEMFKNELEILRERFTTGKTPLTSAEMREITLKVFGK